jgi:hypothetical protein
MVYNHEYTLIMKRRPEGDWGCYAQLREFSKPIPLASINREDALQEMRLKFQVTPSEGIEVHYEY